MNGQIPAALVAVGAMVLFAGSAGGRAVAQSSSRLELNAASAQDNGQQASPPQNSDDTRRDDHGATIPDVMMREDQTTIGVGGTTADRTFQQRASVSRCRQTR
jgi:hypothetical protein